MNRKFICAAVVTLVVFGVAMADEFGAIISKVEDGKVTFQKFKFNKEDKKIEKIGEPTTLPTTSTVKVSKGKFDKETKKMVAGEAIEGGLKSDAFTKIPEKGMNAFIVTDADGKNITEIRVGGGKGGKKKKTNN